MEIFSDWNLQEQRELICTFFVLFSRFEYALKRLGYISPKPMGKRIELDWVRFSEDTEAKFTANTWESIKESVKYLETHQPMKQVFHEGELRFVGISRLNGENRLDWLLRLIRTVRNNLFHGGKFPDGPKYDVARDQKLLESSLDILGACLECNDDLDNVFWEPPA
jgi:hypothetical protein